MTDPLDNVVYYLNLGYSLTAARQMANDIARMEASIEAINTDLTVMKCAQTSALGEG